MRNRFTFELSLQELSAFDEVVTRQINSPENITALQMLVLLNLEDVRIKSSRKLSARFKKCKFSLNKKEAIALFLAFGIVPDTSGIYGYSTIFRMNTEIYKDIV